MIRLFRYVGKTRATSALCNISFGILFKSIQYFSEYTTPNITMTIGYIKIERNYCYHKHKTNLKQCARKEEESMLLISRTKLSKAQG